MNKVLLSTVYKVYMKVVRTAIHSTITSLAARNSYIRTALFAFRSNSEMRNQVAKMVEVAKIDEVIGFSEKSWEDAAQEAVSEAKKSNDSLYTRGKQGWKKGTCSTNNKKIRYSEYDCRSRS